LALQDIVEQTVAGLGYELVELERSAGGTLRVTIDFPWRRGKSPELVNVEDCERVTRQLQYTLEVEEVDYKRLEVSSPGIDRPLRNEKDFERFAGEVVDLTLKAPMGAAAAGQVAANRRKFRGTLEQAPDGRLADHVERRARTQAGPEDRRRGSLHRCRSWVSRWTSSKKRVWRR
jgi:ribosome maturation factor RimP